MARERLERLDGTVADLLDGTRLAEQIGQTFELVTVDADGTPHSALLSAGEVLATSERTIRLALWPTSTTTGNLRERGRGLLTLVADRVFYAIAIRACPAPDLVVGAVRLARFDAKVAVVHRDEVEYAEMTAGLTFRLYAPSTVLPRWERTIEALRASPDAHG